jgi:amino acid transporter
MLNNHVGLIILGIILDLGGGPDHDRIGFRYWKNPGPFVQYNDIAGPKGRFLGFWAVLTQAAFSFIGTEIVAVSLPLSVQNAAQSCGRASKMM